MTPKSETGRIGEDLACKYLSKKGYEIIERNARYKWGELDIVAKDPANTLVFVEVKTMRQNNSAIAGLQSEDNFSRAKEIKTKKAAGMFAGKHSELINEDRGWRVDLISICLTLNKPVINHYENV